MKKEKSKVDLLKAEFSRVSNLNLKRIIEKAGSAGAGTPRVLAAKAVITQRATQIKRAQEAKKQKLKEAAKQQAKIPAAQMTEARFGTDRRTIIMRLENTEMAIANIRDLLNGRLLSDATTDVLRAELATLGGRLDAYRELSENAHHFKEGH